MSDGKPTIIVKQQKKMGCFGIIGVVVVIGLIVAMCNTGNKSSSGTSSSEESQTKQYSLDIRPDSQKQFEQIFRKYSDEFDKAENQLQESKARANRKGEFQQLGIRNVKDWVGTLKRLATNTEGKAFINIDLVNNLTICTWNNAFSDIDGNTLIPMDSDLYKALSSMKVGSKVKFSGTFITGDDMDYFQLSGALTIRSAMKTPDFVMKFSTVTVIGDKPITTSDINLREEPSADSNKLTTIPKGSEVKLLGTVADDGWIKISFEEKEGYVNKQFLTY